MSFESRCNVYTNSKCCFPGRPSPAAGMRGGVEKAWGSGELGVEVEAGT